MKKWIWVFSGALVAALGWSISVEHEPARAEVASVDGDFPSRSQGGGQMIEAGEAVAATISDTRPGDDKNLSEPVPRTPSRVVYASLSEAFEAARHQVQEIDPSAPHSRGAKYFCANPGQDLRAWFGSGGIEIAGGQSGEEWTLGVSLRGLRRSEEYERSGDRTATAGGKRVEIATPFIGLSEWFENRRTGIEQGFTLSRRLRGTGELKIELDLAGSLQAVAGGSADGAAEIWFLSDAGERILRYSGLKAWDADGFDLEVRMELGGSKISLVVADSGARYPITVDPLFSRFVERLSEEPDEGDRFGGAIALSGDTALIGAPGDDTHLGNEAGSVYVFRREGVNWSREANLNASDGRLRGQFGIAVDVEGDRAIIGSWGSAYTYERTGGRWVESSRLLLGDGLVVGFGTSVSISGDSALVGSLNGDSDQGDQTAFGAGYVYDWDGTNWVFQQRLEMPAGSAGGELFNPVALDGDTALVGGPFGADFSGVARVFVRNGGVWEMEQEIPALGAHAAFFGRAVDVEGDTIVIGSDSTGGVGTAHVLVRSGDAWQPKTTLTASISSADASFGNSVALDDGRIVVGAPGAQLIPTLSTGAAFAFALSGSSWIQDGLIAGGTLNAERRRGAAVAIDGDTVLVSSFSNDLFFSAEGAARVFVRDVIGWEEQAQLVGTDPAREDFFGASVALGEEVALVGASGDDTVSSIDAGAAYLFDRVGGLWAFNTRLAPGDLADDDRFGTDVDLDRDTALVGAPGGPFATTIGSAYVFFRRESIWGLQAKLSGTGGSEGNSFGREVALDGDTALVGAPRESTDLAPEHGSAYVFVRDGTTWREEAELRLSDLLPGAEPIANLRFGGSVALDGDTALIGLPKIETLEQIFGGAVTMFERDAGEWRGQVPALTPADGDGGDFFGISIALEGDFAFVGSPRNDEAGGVDAGSVYVFERDGESWISREKLKASDGVPHDGFGTAISVDGSRLAIGTSPLDIVDDITGSVYVFEDDGDRFIERLRVTRDLDSSIFDFFGTSVALKGDTLLVGVPGDRQVGGAGSVFHFTVADLPEIVEQPTSTTVVPGEAVSFSVAATGFAPLRYQWRKDGFEIRGADEPSLLIPAAALADAGSYDVVVSNRGGAVTSAPAVLVVNDLSQFDGISPSPPESAEGAVVVFLAPDDLGGWRFAGEQAWRQSGFLAEGFTPGDREIEYRPVPGYERPLSELVSLADGDPVLILNRSYHPEPAGGETGALTILIEPQSVTLPELPEAERAEWRFFGEGEEMWRDSGSTAIDLPVGEFLIELKEIPLRSAPSALRVRLREGEIRSATAIYRLRPAEQGAALRPLGFEEVAGSSETQRFPYTQVGRLLSELGSSSGFVVRRRVVATAAHVVFDDGSREFVNGLSWGFQYQRGIHEPVPQIPRGIHMMSGYAEAREGQPPGEGTSESHNLDAAALYFLEDVARGGFGGYLASDADSNEFLESADPKTLVGYPVDRVAPDAAGRMHATPPTSAAFDSAFERTYTTGEIAGRGGVSGGPLCVQFGGEGNPFYPAAIYIGGSGGQTVVRAIDSDVIELFDAASDAANGGGNGTGYLVQSAPTRASEGGGTLTVATNVEGTRWQVSGVLVDDRLRESGTQFEQGRGKTVVVEFEEIEGFLAPPRQVLTLGGDEHVRIEANYVLEAYDVWAGQFDFGELVGRGAAQSDLKQLAMARRPSSDPDGDGIDNLLEYAFNLRPDVADWRALDPGGTSGLPVVVVEKVPGGSRLRTESVLRKRVEGQAGLIYYFEFGSTTAGWDSVIVPELNPIDWERVVVADPVVGAPRRFARIRVGYASSLSDP